jgi:hypothetical protein
LDFDIGKKIQSAYNLSPAVAALDDIALLEHLRSTDVKVPVFRAKVMLVGSGGAGKTSLFRALRASPDDLKLLEDDTVTTDGVIVETWETKVPSSFSSSSSSPSTLTLDVWDFAGQEQYFPTHRFFMCEASLYVLVWSPWRREKGTITAPRVADLKFWSVWKKKNIRDTEQGTQKHHQQQQQQQSHTHKTTTNKQDGVDHRPLSQRHRLGRRFSPGPSARRGAQS